MKISITGSTGFVGTNLLQYLEPYFIVDKLHVRYRVGQIIKIESDVVIHLAGKAHDLKKVSNPTDYYESNYELTKQLFDAFLLSDAKVFIFMSTVKAVADSVTNVLTENCIVNPQTHYGIAKRQAEEYILKKDLNDGKRVYILRPCMIHGPGNKGNLNLLFQLVVKGIPWPLGAFDNLRSFLSIQNLCFVIKELIVREDIQSGIYNVADDDEMSTNDLIKLLSESFETSTKILKIPPYYIKVIAKLGDYIPLPLNSERLTKLTESYKVSNDKLISALGKSLPIKAKDGLLKTFKSFRK